MAFGWLFKIEDALLHVLGPPQLNTARDIERRQRRTLDTPPPPPAAPKVDEAFPGGWVRRGTPGNYYIVRAPQTPSPR